MLNSHGWSSLLPFVCDVSAGTCRFPLQTKKAIIDINLSCINGGVEIRSTHKLDKDDLSTIKNMIAFDLDLNLFYKLCEKNKRAWVHKHNMGRLLRSQTLFEDLIKLILTTNCSWAFTEKMVARLTETLGEASLSGQKIFPSAKKMAQKNEAFYRGTIKAGYRSPYLIKLSKMVASGQIDLNELVGIENVENLRKEILKLPGVGPYVADNFLRLVGRFDFLGVDSYVRSQLKTLWRAKNLPSDQAIFKKYKTFGSYKGLMMWCDVTQSWFEKGE